MDGSLSCWKKTEFFLAVWLESLFITEIQRASLTHLGLAPTDFQRKQEEDGKPADLISAATQNFSESLLFQKHQLL